MVAAVSPASSLPDGANPNVAVPASFVADPLAYFAPGREDEAVRYASAVAADPAAPAVVRKNALLTAGAVQLAKGRIHSARMAFAEILERDPSADIDQPDRVPGPALALFYRMRDSVCTSSLAALTSQGKLGPDIRTIAVGDMENNSLVHGEFDLDHFAKGLVHVLTGDLSGGTPLKVVDRQRLSVLRDEIGMNQDAKLMDPQTRVKLGHLCGAQSFLFGQVMLLDKNHMRIDLRWVDTSTGEILLSEAVEGAIGSASDLFKLERKLLLEVLAPHMEAYLKKAPSPTQLQPQLKEYFDKKSKSVPKSYTAAMVSAGNAVASEENGDYAQAAASWGQVAAAVPTDRVAGARALTLTSYQRMTKD